MSKSNKQISQKMVKVQAKMLSNNEVYVTSTSAPSTNREQNTMLRITVNNEVVAIVSNQGDRPVARRPPQATHRGKRRLVSCGTSSGVLDGDAGHAGTESQGPGKQHPLP